MLLFGYLSSKYGMCLGGPYIVDGRYLIISRVELKFRILVVAGRMRNRGGGLFGKSSIISSTG